MATFDKIKTPSQLKAFVENGKYYGYESFYFTRDSMKFFGDTMANYGIRHHNDENGHYIELYRKKPVKHGLNGSSYWKLLENSGNCAAKQFHF